MLSIKFHRSFFLRVSLTIRHHDALPKNRRQAIIWTNDGMIYWRTCVTRPRWVKPEGRITNCAKSSKCLSVCKGECHDLGLRAISDLTHSGLALSIMSMRTLFELTHLNSEAETKWFAISWRHFQMHFLLWKCTNFAHDFIRDCS